MTMYISSCNFVTGQVLWESCPIYMGQKNIKEIVSGIWTNSEHAVPTYIKRSVKIRADGQELQAILEWNKKNNRLLIGEIDKVHTFVSVAARKILDSLEEILLYNSHDILRDNKNFDFTLTGSRFFGPCREDSDWDYFVEDSPELIRFLYDNGFVKNYGQPSDYSSTDPTLLAVWQKDDVDIQVVRKGLLWKKRLAQKIIKENNLLWRGCLKTNDLRKEDARIVWESVFAAINACNSCPARQAVTNMRGLYPARAQK